MIRYTLRGRPLRDPAEAEAVPRLPRQACADARQHGGRRTLLPRRERREVPSLRTRSRGSISRRANPARSSCPRPTGTTDSNTSRSWPADTKGTKTCSRRAISKRQLKKGESIIFSASLDEMGSTKTIEEVFAASIARRTHKIDFISCLRTLGAAVPDPPSGRPDRSGVGISVARAFRAARPSSRCRASRSNRDTRRTASTRWIRWCGRCATACSPAAPRPKSRRTLPLWFFWTLQQLEREVGGQARYGRATARP